MIRILILLTLLLFCAQPLLAITTQYNPHNLRELIVLGLETHLGLQVDRFSVASGTEAITIEAAEFDSTLFAAVGYDRSSVLTGSSLGSIHAEDLSGQAGISKLFETGLSASLSLHSEWSADNDPGYDLDPRYRTALLIDLTQPLLRGLGVSVNTTRLQVSRNQQQQVALEYLLKAQHLILQLEVMTRQLGAKTEIIRLSQTALDLADELYLANQNRFIAGVIPVTEVQEAETALAARQLSLSLAIQDRDVLQEELNRQLNHRLSSDFDPGCLIDFDLGTKIIELPDFDQLFVSAQQQRLELKISDYAVQSSSLQLEYSHNQLKPRLDLNLQVGINGLSGHERTSVTVNQYSGNWMDSLGSMSETDGYQWRAGLEFSLPIGHRAAKSRHRQSALLLKQNHYRQKDLLAMIKAELLQQQINIVSTREQMVITDRLEVLAEKSFQQEQRRLNEGLSDTFRMIFFQQKMIAAKIDRINAITRYHLALAQMEFSTGTIFERHNIILTDKTEELNLENI